MAALAYPALDSDPVALDATELEEPSAADEAYDLARAQFPEPFGAGLGAAFAPLVPDDVIPRLGVALGLAALLVALAALRLSRSPLSAIALGLTAALPAAATTGLFELLWRRPNAAVMLCAAGTILAVSAVRSASAAGLLAHAGRGRRRGRRISRATIPPATLASIAGVLACGGLAWVLFPPLDALAVVLAAGLAVDLVVVRWIVVPALARARLRRAVT